jgi:hypothetical protein
MAADGERESSRKPFYERGSFKAAAAVVGLVGGLWALLGAPKPIDLADQLTDEAALPYRNAEIILDASTQMGEKLGDSTKLAVAAAAAGRYATAGEEVGLALRRAGGSCDNAGEQLVDFGKGHGAEIKEKAAEQEAGGESNLTQAVRTAIGDFSGGEFHRTGSENVIVVFVGSSDSCEGEAGELIRSELESADIAASFELFALDVSAKTLKNLKEFEQQLEGVAAVHLSESESAEELEEQVEEVAPELEAGELAETFESDESPTEEGSEEATEASEGETEAEEALQPESGEEPPAFEEGGEAEGEGP